jgi:hypothetical protein
MTGETILPDEGNELLGGVLGVIWSDPDHELLLFAVKS